MPRRPDGRSILVVKLIGPVIAFFLLIAAANAGDAVHIALHSMCDPAKIATLESERAANPRIRKITYWLEIGRREGRPPENEMAAAMDAIGWGGTLRRQFTVADSWQRGPQRNARRKISVVR